MIQTFLSDWEEFIINKSFVVEIPQKCVGKPLLCLDLRVCGVYVVSCVFYKLELTAFSISDVTHL